MASRGIRTEQILFDKGFVQPLQPCGMCQASTVTWRDPRRNQTGRWDPKVSRHCRHHICSSSLWWILDRVSRFTLEGTTSFCLMLRRISLRRIPSTVVATCRVVRREQKQTNQHLNWTAIQTLWIVDKAPDIWGVHHRIVWEVHLKSDSQIDSDGDPCCCFCCWKVITSIRWRLGKHWRWVYHSNDQVFWKSQQRRTSTIKTAIRLLPPPLASVKEARKGVQQQSFAVVVVMFLLPKMEVFLRLFSILYYLHLQCCSTHHMYT